MSRKCTIPDGYQLADGSQIQDVDSPLLFENTPNLINTFIKGVAPGNLDTTGGSTLHAHSMQNHLHDTGTAGGHSHTVNPSATNTATTSPVHNHRWSQLTNAEEWRTWEGDGVTTQIMVNWGDGMDSDGDGHFPISKSCAGNNCTLDSFYTQAASTNHNHSYDVPNTVTSTASSHTHGFTGSPNVSSTGGTSNEPPWHGLVKIIRIK